MKGLALTVGGVFRVRNNVNVLRMPIVVPMMVFVFANLDTPDLIVSSTVAQDFME